jgi:RNA polymerase sigma factor (sigma-70 family)
MQGLIKLGRNAQAGGSDQQGQRTDAELVTACLAGEADAWDALIARSGPLIYSVALRMGLAEADAQDVVQDVCLLMLHHLHALRDNSRLAGWLVATTRREVWRLQQRRRPALLSEMPEGMPEAGFRPLIAGEEDRTPEEILLALEDQALVRRALESMPEKCRRLLTLLYCTDPPCSYSEVGERLSMARGSIGPSRARCLQQLQKILKKAGF